MTSFVPRPSLFRSVSTAFFGKSSAVIVRPTKMMMVLSERTMVSSTRPVLEKRIIKVPSMGDSITEGTIVEWTAPVGKAVKDGEVVALVETDKVTVELKAVVDGVITQQFGAVNDTVQVGGDLYEIDTDAAEVPPAALPTPADATPEKPLSTQAPSPTTSEELSHRTPSIHFLGKEGWARMLNGHGESLQPTSTSTVASTENTSTPPSPAKAVKVVDAGPIHPMYGRPIFSESEMEALILGGANVAPQVMKHSTGAKFK